jgi:pyridoxal 5'-phosphate synthase pdxT subunit
VIETVNIGVLALQGDVAEHSAMLTRLGAQVSQVRLPGELQALDGLIIPGGESTTIGKLATTYGLIEPLRRFAQERPVWGTCAGAIFLSRDTGRRQPLLGLMDITVERNAFGRQVDSFITDLHIEGLEDGRLPFRAVFIRAPILRRVGPQVQVLASLPSSDGQASERIVAARQGHWLATSFHPELTDDERMHRYFLSLIRETAAQ